MGTEIKYVYICVCVCSFMFMCVYLCTYIHTHIFTPHPTPNTEPNRAFEAQCLQRAEGDAVLTDRQKKKARDRLAQLYKRQAALPLAEGCKVRHSVGAFFLCIYCVLCIVILFIMYVGLHLCGGRWSCSLHHTPTKQPRPHTDGRGGMTIVPRFPHRRLTTTPKPTHIPTIYIHIL